MNNMTALVSAFARAYHTEKYTVPIFSDPIAGMLLGEDYQQIAQTMAQGIRFFAPDFQGSEEEALRLIVDRQLSPAPLGRAAFAERSLKTAVALGTEQYLLFGAGYDTFALRQPEWAQKLQIFELDLPESVADKQQRIQKAGLSIPENTFYLPVDLSQEEWQKILLEHKSFSPEKRSFCSLLGLVYYLPQEAFENLLDRLQDLLPEGSALVLDYPMKQGEGQQSEKQKALAQGAGEPMKAVYEQEEMEQLLSRRRFGLYEHLTPKEMTEQYFALHNKANPQHPMEAMEAVGYCLAVKK